MNVHSEDFKVEQGHRVKLDKYPTDIKPLFESEKDYEQTLQKYVKQLGKLQNLLYASNIFSLLIVFQSMDAAGKDSTIKHVMSGVNPQGCQVQSFQHPSAGELEHDFLWRAINSLPPRRMIGVFNRSYYEEVLIVRVHPEILENEGIHSNSKTAIWRGRYKSIVEFEKHLYRNDTRIIKVFLHLSKEEQRKRFLKRLDDPEKNWKFSMSDINEREFWDQYKYAYEQCLEKTSTKHAPWYIVPADGKENSHIIVSQIIVDTIRNLHLRYPTLTTNHSKELSEIRKRLLSD